MKIEVDPCAKSTVTLPVMMPSESLIVSCPVCGRRMQLMPTGLNWVWTCPIHGAGSYTVSNTTTPDMTRITYQASKSINLEDTCSR